MAYKPLQIRIKAIVHEGHTSVVLQLTHPMESGFQKNIRGQKIPRHFIREVEVYHQNHLLISAQLNYTISNNSKWKFSFVGGKVGDDVIVHWLDNLKLERVDRVKIKT